MKKLMNSPDDYVDEMLDGLCAAHPMLVRTGERGRVIRDARSPASGKVGIVSGGGSGHLPLFTGYVGQGLVSACAVGEVFAGPAVGDCVTAIKAADAGQGVLCLYGNYGGDRMNFDLAGELVEEDGIRTKTVLGCDDIASASPDEWRKRRGVAGLIFAYKVAGAAAERNADLDEVTRIASKAVERTRTIGCALYPCQVPGAAEPTFQLGDDEMEMGMGIHGEPGLWRRQLASADAVATEMVERLLDDLPAPYHEQVWVMVNSLGATSLDELFILYRRVKAELDRRGITVVRPLIGHLATSMEMGGCSVSLIGVDDELNDLLGAPADCPFWRNAS